MTLDRYLFAETFTLPGGYVDDEGVTLCEGELAPLTGFEEEWLDGLGSTTCSAGIVTALLSRCIKRLGKLAPAGIPLVRDLLVSDREFLMLKLRELTFGKRLNAELFCADARCGESMDVTLNLDDLAPNVKPVDRRIFKLEIDGDGESSGFEIEFRLPTGADQEAALDWIRGDATAAVNRLLAKTITKINGNTSIEVQTVAGLPARVSKAIEERMEELSPLISVELEATCVECKKPFLTHFDITSFFLAEVRQSRRLLEREVHCIARNYHWPEREILALTRQKRRRYIELIQGEIAATFSVAAFSRGVA